MSFERLLAPLRVGALTLRNRVVMGSMHTRLEHLDRSTEREIAFYAARARGGASLVITAGCSPNEAGRLEPGAHVFDSEAQLAAHRAITTAVREAGAPMLLQILHAGRYAKHDALVAPSAVRSPINPRTPRALDEAGIERTIEDFVRCARLAQQAGYAGVEIMGSEGYLLTQFTASRTNTRTDQWGGSFENRCRFPLEILRRMRAALGPGFVIFYRISALDLVDGGLRGPEIAALAREVERAGADALSTGIGWHEARVPTISYHVPRAAWAFTARHLRRAVAIPVVASNRINDPVVAERLLAAGDADLVALARPLLADPDFVAKLASGRAREIVPCIACNQACLDYIFTDRSVSCLVNPRAGRELDDDAQARARTSDASRGASSGRIAIVGAGPAGLACAVEAASRRLRVTLFEADMQLGGQLRLARRVPGKSEFDGLLAWFAGRLAALDVDRRLGETVSARQLLAERFDAIVIATGVRPRRPAIPGVAHRSVASYEDILSGARQAGRRVVIIGAGGIGFDVAEYLSAPHHRDDDLGSWLARWGVDASLERAGGLCAPLRAARSRDVTLVQRSSGRFGMGLGVSTGWVLREQLKAQGVNMLGGCRYLHIDDEGLHVERKGRREVLAADTIVLCAGQEPVADLAAELRAAGVAVELIGGALRAEEIDATRAIDEGVRLALKIAARVRGMEPATASAPKG